MPSPLPPLVYSLPLDKRPPPSISDYIQVFVFNAVFLLGILGLHSVQVFLAMPFYVSQSTLSISYAVGRVAQSTFAKLLVLISMVWAPTVIRVTVDTDGNDDTLNLDKIVRYNDQGIAVGLDLPERMVLMSNHQVYCDWSYIWNLLYFGDLQANLIIILKASLKWIPVVGPAMQCFRFVFISRNWAADRDSLGRQLNDLAERASRSLDSFVLLIFPEGTLVSPLTRPPSEAYAKKQGIEDCRHLLLPRSTGLLFCLRSLSPRIPDLKLVDLTIGYPGVPAGGYGQDFYTLQSIFGRGAAPPIIHMHLRSYSVRYDVPIGALSTSESRADVRAQGDATDAEKKGFEEWTLKRWREKDNRLDVFLQEETLAKGKKFVDIPVRLRSPQELLALLLVCILGLWFGKTAIMLLWRLVVRR